MKIENHQLLGRRPRSNFQFCNSILLAAVTMAAAGCHARDAHSRLGEIDRYPRLETVQPLLHTVLPIKIELSATVEAMEKADLCARVPGIIQFLERDMDIGRRVKAGETLLKVDVSDLDAELKAKEALWEQAKKQKLLVAEAIQVAARELDEARKQEKRYRSDYEFRKLEYERVARLAESEAVQRQRAEESRNQTESAESAWEAARAQVEIKLAKLQAAGADLAVAESRIKVAEADARKLAVLVSYALVKAPFSGIITKRWIDRGAMVKDPGVPLLTVMRADVVRVILDIPERDVPLVNATEQNPNPDKLGDHVELRIPALRDGPGDKPIAGTITRLTSVLDPNTRTMRAEMHMPNKDGYLRPGMYGKATIYLEERYNVTTVPSTALVRRENQVELFYVDESPDGPSKGIVRRAQVTLGVDDGHRVQVRGLKGTERIIAKGNGVVREGDTVIAVPLRP